MIFVYISLALISLATTATSTNSAVDSINGFTVNLFKDILDVEQGNFVMSPLSVDTLLAIVELGSKGRSKQELRTALKYSQTESFGPAEYHEILQDLKRKLSKSTLEFANMMFVAYSTRLQTAFQKTIGNFTADVRKMDFRKPNLSARKINDWVSDATRGKITSIISPDSITEDTRMILTNAMYFHGVWEKQFNVNLTAYEGFSTDPNISGMKALADPSKLKVVPMMKLTGTFSAGTDPVLGAKWVHLPFHNGDFSMVLVLPTDESGVNGLSKRLTEESIIKMIHTRRTKSVALALPRFEISTELSLIDAIRRLGVNDIFSPSADLSGISQDRLFVDKILHKAEIEVNEEGSRAAAATAVLVNTLSLSLSEDLEFYANQPFLFFLIKNNPTYPLFVGRVTDPQTKSDRNSGTKSPNFQKRPRF